MDSLMLAALPYHGTNEFVRLLQVGAASQAQPLGKIAACACLACVLEQRECTAFSLRVHGLGSTLALTLRSRRLVGHCMKCTVCAVASAHGRLVGAHTCLHRPLQRPCNAHANLTLCEGTHLAMPVRTREGCGSRPAGPPAQAFAFTSVADPSPPLSKLPLPAHAPLSSSACAALQVLPLDPARGLWAWLAPAQTAGTSMPRELLVARCVNDPRVLNFLCQVRPGLSPLHDQGVARAAAAIAVACCHCCCSPMPPAFNLYEYTAELLGAEVAAAVAAGAAVLEDGSDLYAWLLILSWLCLHKHQARSKPKYGMDVKAGVPGPNHEPTHLALCQEVRPTCFWFRIFYVLAVAQGARKLGSRRIRSTSFMSFYAVAMCEVIAAVQVCAHVCATHF